MNEQVKSEVKAKIAELEPQAKAAFERFTTAEKALENSSLKKEVDRTRTEWFEIYEKLQALKSL